MKPLHRPGEAAACLLAALSIGGVLPALAGPVHYDLAFNTSGQSMWSTGQSFQFDRTKFIGAQWTNQRVDKDAIVGDESTNVPNPLRLAYDAAFSTCNALFSASACINGQSFRAAVPALGSRPSIRSCGTFAVGCHIARAGDFARRAAYDAAFAACTVGFSDSVCRNGQSFRAAVPALGTAPPQYLNLDTRSGFALHGTTDGRVGLELGISIDSGSVDATVAYKASFDIPDTAGRDKSTPIQFNPASVLTSASSLATTFPTMVMSVDAIMQLSGSISAEACVIPAGCATGGPTFHIDKTLPVLSFNKDGQGGILLLGQTPSDLGVDPVANGFPLDLEVAGHATATFHLPQPHASGGLDATTQTIKASGQDDLLDLIVDIDKVMTTLAGLPPVLGVSVDIPLVGSIGYDIINVGMGPTIDLKQDFELDPTLFVSLAFDKAVQVGGALVTQLVSAWDLLPSITFLDEVTTVTPVFFVQALLQNHTNLDFDLDFLIDLLQIHYDFGLLGDGILGIGNVLDKGIDLFETPALFSNLFPLQGFDLQRADSFVIDFSSGSRGPQNTVAVSAVNPIVLPGSDRLLPEPATGWLVLSAVLAAALGAQRRRRGPGAP